MRTPCICICVLHVSVFVYTLYLYLPLQLYLCTPCICICITLYLCLCTPCICICVHPVSVFVYTLYLCLCTPCICILYVYAAAPSQQGRYLSAFLFLILRRFPSGLFHYSLSIILHRHFTTSQPCPALSQTKPNRSEDVLLK